MSEALVLEAHAAGRIWATAVRPDVIYGKRDRQFVPRIAGLLQRGFAPLIGGGRTTLPIVHAANVADGFEEDAQALYRRVGFVAHEREVMTKKIG